MSADYNSGRGVRGTADTARNRGTTQQRNRGSYQNSGRNTRPSAGTGNRGSVRPSSNIRNVAPQSKVIKQQPKEEKQDKPKQIEEPKKKKGIMKRFRKKLRRVLLIITAFFLICILAVGGWFYLKYGKTILRMQNEAKGYVAASTAETFRQSQTSLVYAADGSLISTLKGEKDVYYLTLDSIPDAVKNAFLATEDRKFYEHGGIDLIANVRASILLIKNKGEIHQGASTITQQLARCIFLTNQVTWERKITEIFLADLLERKYSKDQILEFYLNNIYFGNGYYGIQAAAIGYFSQSAQELSLSELAFLCTIPNNPTKYNPLTKFENTMERRDKVLDQMEQEGYITSGECKKAKKEKIKLNVAKGEIKNYVESYAYYCAIRALMKQGGFVFQNEFADDASKEAYEDSYYEAYYHIQKTLFTGGYRIYTSLDLEKQELLQNAVNETLQGFTAVNDEGVYKLQGAAVCIDNDSGYVIAAVGGREQDQEGYTLNRAYQSFRQPGSAIKPLVVYTPMFEQGMRPENTVYDEKIEGGPRNADGTFSGAMSVRRAVEISKNTVAWKLFLELTPQKALSYLYQMGFSKLCSDDYVPAASLGGLTYGTSPVEMASAYAALSNGGVFREPTCIVKIMDAQGGEIVGEHREEKRIYKEEAVVMMTDVLKGVMTNGTGRRLKLSGITSAGKTGTTVNQKDGWFCGYSGYYTTAVWVGNDMPAPLGNLAGNTYPGSIWKQFMQKIHQGLADREFTSYEPKDEDKEEIIWGEEERKNAEKPEEEKSITATPTPTEIVAEDEPDDSEEEEPVVTEAPEDLPTDPEEEITDTTDTEEPEDTDINTDTDTEGDVQEEPSQEEEDGMDEGDPAAPSDEVTEDKEGQQEEDAEG